MDGALGISIGTRTIGFAVLYNNELLDWRIKTFPGKWTEKKQERILRMFERLLSDRYRITSITLKAPIPALCSENIMRLVKAIQKLAKSKQIHISYCTVQELKRRYMETVTRTNKEVFISALMQKYPELTGYDRYRAKRQVYYTKLFEAIVCAEIAQETRP